MDFVLIWPSLSLVSSYSWGGVPEKRDSCRDELSPEYSLDKTYMGSGSIGPIWNPIEVIVCLGVSEKRIGFGKLNKILFFAYGRKDDSHLKKGGGLGTIVLPPDIVWVWSLGGWWKPPELHVLSLFSDTQLFRVWEPRYLNFMLIFK